MEFKTLTKVAQDLKVPPSTIKGYEARGVVPRFVRDSAGRRILTEFDVAAIQAHMARRSQAAA